MRMFVSRRVSVTLDNPASHATFHSISSLLFFVALFLPLLVYGKPCDSCRVATDSTRIKSGALRVYHVKPGIDYVYEQPPTSRYYTFPVRDFGGYFKKTFRKENIPYIGAMVIATAFLVDRDQAITDYAFYLGDQWGLGHTNKQKPVIKWSIKVGGKPIDTPLNFPQDLESGMYFLGDGIVHSSIAVGLWGYGKLAKDDRAIQTGTQCVEAILTTGIAIQILKHSFGRETANTATVPGGKWRPFPNPVEYQRHVPNYDAMPSGHVATATAVITVIADNYPEKKWIRPAGYTLMSALMFAMLNNGVHWASDYPLGISIGYTMAKVIDARSHTVFVDPARPKHHAGLVKSTQLLPYVSANGTGLTMNVKF